ncbi:unnamed protein product [Hermetia illucens]|uniref:Uncharacterized protein n=1 Tax=Hermetia illucens TaxID=343691 RepID=A0A7R8ULM9_HERIL|nr:unnamed protein product [Hermetia illucens]
MAKEKSYQQLNKKINKKLRMTTIQEHHEEVEDTSDGALKRLKLVMKLSLEFVIVKKWDLNLHDTIGKQPTV